MNNIKLIRDNPEFVVQRLSKKNFDASTIVEEIIEIDRERRSIQTELDNYLYRQNTLSKTIGELMKSGDKAEAERIKEEVSALKERGKQLDNQLVAKAKAQEELLVLLPNMPHESVPFGKSVEDNELVREGGEIPFSEGFIPHWELAKKYDIIDFDLGVKITGAGFPVYKGRCAKLQRALITHFLEMNTAAGYVEVQPPLLVNEASGFGTGQLPDKGEQMYFVGLDNMYLIPTAEVPVTNIFRDTILSDQELPIKLTAYTPCFRREAGSYGKDVRGLNRLHQFDKVEIVQISNSESSYDLLEGMVRHVESVVQSLELPYRIIRLCGGDMSFTSALTYDFEVFSAAQKRWLEVSSVSNFESFQANRLKLRYKDIDGKISVAHTLNGSSLALPRILAAILENNQDSRGIKIPQALVKYTGFSYIE